MIKSNELVVDNFAGGGGASSGIELGLDRHVDIAINHDPLAIEMHKMNHPETKHYCESVWDVDPVKACAGKSVGLAWFSPDCKHFSRAKGGKPVDKNIRGLAWIAVRWAAKVSVRIIMLENVQEFLTWGPLDDNDKPDKEKKGETFKAFISCLTSGICPKNPALEEIKVILPEINESELINGLGYSVDWQVLSACDYGAPTIRKRLFLVARKDDKPIKWPTKTHGHGLMPFRTAADIINWNLTCKSIFNRKRPLAEKTMQRIANGINKYVINNKKPFIVPDEKTTPFITECANGSSQRNMSADEPLRTICAGGLHIGEVRAFLIQYYGNSTSNNLNKPLGTVTSKDRFGLVTIACEDYQIIDIGLRMLSPAELFAAQGFSKDYIIDMDSKGNKLTITNQVARCGNAVCPPVAKALVEANFYINKQLKIA